LTAIEDEIHDHNQPAPSMTVTGIVGSVINAVAAVASAVIITILSARTANMAMDFGVELPALTHIIISITDTMAQFWVVTLPGIFTNFLVFSLGESYWRARSRKTISWPLWTTFVIICCTLIAGFALARPLMELVNELSVVTAIR